MCFRASSYFLGAFSWCYLSYRNGMFSCVTHFEGRLRETGHCVQSCLYPKSSRLLLGLVSFSQLMSSCPDRVKVLVQISQLKDHHVSKINPSTLWPPSAWELLEVRLLSDN
ncbi:hypothetical protein AMECASPLE_037664 [Ameca splendens]|uniref:Secreted protein n=1 Tax=Ameca splendens TaxID=208324 RepID=A0ABV0Y850_9TELE